MLLVMLLAGVICVMASAMDRPTHVVKSRHNSYVAMRLDREEANGRHARFVVQAGDSIYPISEEYASGLTKHEQKRYQAGMVEGVPVLIDKDFVDELVWDDQSAQTASAIDRKEKDEAKERFEQMIYGENRVNGNVWYYVLGFFIATLFIDGLKGRPSGKEEKEVFSGPRLYIGAMTLVALFVVEYGFCYFGMSNINDWMRGERGNEFLNLLFIIPKCLCFVVLVIMQFRLWYALMAEIGNRINGRIDYSLTALLVSLAVAAVGISAFFFVKQMPTVMYVSIALVLADLILTLFLDRRNLPMALLTAALYVTGVMAMFELLAIFGLLLLVIVAIVVAASLIIAFIQNPGKITHLVRVDGRVIGKVFEGSDTIYFDNGSSAGMSEIHSTRIKIDPKD